mmetsp:Transcript_22907/g.71142  ORF Transcript_22907/g.71142 Transcript_22907/m.71142 type:complete len:357 (+) Transcript_22907:1683-2753(+)
MANITHGKDRVASAISYRLHAPLALLLHLHNGHKGCAADRLARRLARRLATELDVDDVGAAAVGDTRLDGAGLLSHGGGVRGTIAHDIAVRCALKGCLHRQQPVPGELRRGAAEDLVHVLPHFVVFALEAVDLRGARADDLPLVEDHAERERAEEHGLEHEQYDPDATAGVREAGVLGAPRARQRPVAPEHFGRDEEERVGAHREDIRDEEDEEFVVAHADAVVHPRAVVVHLDDAAPADAAVVRALRLEVSRTALAALDQARVAAGAVRVLVRRRARRLRQRHGILGHSTGVGEHGAQVACERAKRYGMKKHQIQHTERRPSQPRVDDVRRDDAARVEHERPGDESADHAAGLQI